MQAATTAANPAVIEKLGGAVLDITTGRPATLAPNGLVTSPHALASTAGVDVLRAGGSAVDGAIATSAVLAVVYPHMTGLGGDAFWLIHDGASGEISHLNGGGKAAAGATIAALAARGGRENPLRGIIPATPTLPGAVASRARGQWRYARLPLQRVRDAAISYARDGFPVTARLSSFIAMMRDDIARQREAARIFLPDGDVPSPNSKLRNPDLAVTLEAIADRGWPGFYEG